MRWSTMLVATTVCGIVAGNVAATTIVVSKGGANPTIQSGLNAAVSGDTVLVKAGVYKETPNVLASKTGIVVRGVGEVIIDARTSSGAPDGDGLTISASNVTIEKLTIRHAGPSGTTGFGVRVLAPDVTLRKLTVIASAQAGINASGDRLILSNCVVRHCLSGIFVTGANARVEQCVIDQALLIGISTSGIGPIVRKNVVHGTSIAGIVLAGANSGILENNVVTAAGGPGIAVDGTSLVVAKNVVDGTHDAIGVDGNSAVLTGNQVRACSGFGIQVAGDSATLTGNRVYECHGIAIAVDGGSAVLIKNRVDSAPATGIELSGDSATVVSNVVSRCLGDGVHVLGASAKLEKNVATDCGLGIDGYGIRLQGLTGTVSGNVARRCSNGFRISSGSALLTKNLARDSVRDGFDIALGSLITLEANVAKGNQAEGIENTASSTTLTNNVCTGNRIDVATTVPFASFTANSFATGGASTPPEID